MEQNKRFRAPWKWTSKLRGYRDAKKDCIKLIEEDEKKPAVAHSNFIDYWEWRVAAYAAECREAFLAKNHNKIARYNSLQAVVKAAAPSGGGTDVNALRAREARASANGELERLKAEIANDLRRVGESVAAATAKARAGCNAYLNGAARASKHTYALLESFGQSYQDGEALNYIMNSAGEPTRKKEKEGHVHVLEES